MIRLENIGKVFHAGTPHANRVIRDLSLDVTKGEFITIIGSN